MRLVETSYTALTHLTQEWHTGMEDGDSIRSFVSTDIEIFSMNNPTGAGAGQVGEEEKVVVQDGGLAAIGGIERGD